ncbi:MAG: conjugal transfer protein [Enterococcus sp.]|nr:conjugal transfer protein [Enterococcus sp.]
MSANIFGDDDDDFVLAPGSDGSEPIKRVPPQRPTPQSGGAPKPPTPSTGTSSLPRRSGVTKASSLPPRSGLPTRTPPQSALPQIRKETSLPSAPATKLPPRGRVNPAPMPAPAPTPVPEPVYEEPVYEEPVYEEPEPQYVAPAPVPAPEPVYQAPTYEPVYEAPEYESAPEPPRREEHRPAQRYPSERIDRINQNRDEYDPDNMDDRTTNRRNFNEAFEDSEATNRRRVSQESENTRSKKKKKTPAQIKKESKQKSPSKFAGGRKGVLVVRIGASLAVLALMAQGVNSIVNPPKFPSQADFMAVVNQNLGVTEFPLDNANAFVLSFTQEYMNITAETSNDRRENLRAYASDTLVSTMANGTPQVNQKISDGPIIVGTEAKDDANAIYNVGVKVGPTWVYLDIPVYYDKDSLGFAISGTPSFTAPPIKAEAPSVKREYEIDAKLGNEILPNLTSFFEAWGKSDEEGLGRYTTKDADVETKAGLQNTAILSKVEKIEVEAKDEEDPTANTRKGTATVIWSSNVDPKITYSQNYNLEFFLQPDGRWYVADITGGVVVN